MSVLTMMPADIELSVQVDQKEDLAGGLAAAVFDSRVREYRYLLTRIWDPDVKPVVFLMLNPSTADALEDDPTIRRCTSFARRERAGGLVVVNLFGLRSTDPRALLHHRDPVGRYNDAFVRQATDQASKVICAWGAAGVTGDRGREVTRALEARKVPLFCLGRTSTGQPRHPLYLLRTAALEPYGASFTSKESKSS
ncbi:DUF1643 domain-containing protein [Streptomyces pseudovenezuelae]|uniref:DUF1643 domain-containing protein n=1 Tax=Streptomyces pseudovenezuelae TaxID=67350 RepID=UPI0036E7EEA5